VSVDVDGGGDGSGVGTFPGDANGATLDIVYSSGERQTIIGTFDIPSGSFSS